MHPAGRFLGMLTLVVVGAVFFDRNAAAKTKGDESSLGEKSAPELPEAELLALPVPAAGAGTTPQLTIEEASDYIARHHDAYMLGHQAAREIEMDRYSRVVEDGIDTSPIGNMASSDGATPSDNLSVLMSAPVYPGPDSCVDSAEIVCAWDTIYTAPHWDLTVTTTQPITIKTYNLQPFQGSVPDTLVYLLRCDTSACQTGTIVAIDDNYNDETPYDWDSKIVFTPSQTGTYRILLTSWYQGSEGYTNLSYQINGQNPVVYSGVFFGGYHVKWKLAKAKDSIFVGKNSNGMGWSSNPEYSDSVLYYLGTMAEDCVSGQCGPFFQNDDRTFGSFTSTLSKIDLPSDYVMNFGRILVASYAPTAQFNGRVFHYRKHTSEGGNWSESSKDDVDGDGLSTEIETQIGTCDWASTSGINVGIGGFNCQQFANWVNAAVPGSWSPTDSDNDGLKDNWEIQSVVVACPSTPVGPYWNAGSCMPLALHSAATCPGAYCTGLDLSARSDPDPTVYDVFLLNDYWNCSGTSYCAGDHVSKPNPHSISASQQGRLVNLWSTLPSLCWDGTNPPCADAVNDIPYRARIHAYNGTARNLGDDTFGAEFPFGGTKIVDPYYHFGFPSSYKETKTFRYSLATHGNGGQSPLRGRLAVWGNGWEPDILLTLSHELGHTLSIDDTKYDDLNAPPYCPEAFNRGGGQVWMQVPNYASIMTYMRKDSNYFYQPSPLPPSVANPDFDQTLCSWTHAKFSKGIPSNPINEAALVESYARNWQNIHLVQDLFCFNDWNSPGATNPYHPYCDATTCYVDWDALRARTPMPPPGTPYSFDVSYGRSPPNTTLAQCDDDIINDINDWKQIFTRGKEGLAATASTDYSVYADTYNASAPSNLAGWTYSIISNVEYLDSVQPINHCDVGTICSLSGGTAMMCIDDYCAVGADCRAAGASCSSGMCTCSADSDCYSSHCNTISGVCEVERGLCQCQTDDDCVAWWDGGPHECDALKHICKGERPANLVTDSAYGAPRKVAHFRGTSSSDSIRLVNAGSTSPIWTIGSDKEAFTISFDMQFHQFGPGQSAATLITSGSFKLQVIDNAGLRLRLDLPGTGVPSMYYPPAGSGWTMRANTWYHVVWSVQKQSEQYISVTAWNPESGWYDGGLQDSKCYYKPITNLLSATNDVWIGYDGASSTSRFDGTIDNLAIQNYRSITRPGGCVVQ